MSKEVLSTSDIKRARRIAAEIANAPKAPTRRRIEAIELDNWLSGDAPMPGGGQLAVRTRLRKLRRTLEASKP